jgi:hypothetical protein
MTDRHLAYVGHFVHDGKFAKYTIDSNTRLTLPCLERKLTQNDLECVRSATCLPTDCQRRIVRDGYWVGPHAADSVLAGQMEDHQHHDSD